MHNFNKEDGVPLISWGDKVVKSLYMRAKKNKLKILSHRISCVFRIILTRFRISTVRHFHPRSYQNSSKARFETWSFVTYSRLESNSPTSLLLDHTFTATQSIFSGLQLDLTKVGSLHENIFKMSSHKAILTFWYYTYTGLSPYSLSQYPFYASRDSHSFHARSMSCKLSLTYQSLNWRYTNQINVAMYLH